VTRLSDGSLLLGSLPLTPTRVRASSSSSCLAGGEGRLLLPGGSASGSTSCAMAGSALALRSLECVQAEEAARTAAAASALAEVCVGIVFVCVCVWACARACVCFASLTQ
jgi:hypothetical protein